MRIVSGAGNTNVDLLYTGMPRVPQEGEEIYAQGFSMQLGGGIPATLITLGRLGVPSHIQTFLGQDMFSRFAKEQFENSGVWPLNLYEGAGMAINLTSAVITAKDRAFISYTEGVEVTENDRARVAAASEGAAVVLMDERFLPIYPSLKDKGSLMVFDRGWDDSLSLETLAPTLQLADFYTPNDKEALKITGAKTVSEAARKLAEVLDTVIIKLGSRGCLVYEAGRERVVGAIPHVRAVDATGAGDAFLAGFVYGLYHGVDIDRAVLYGNITGAACVEGVGCLSSYVNEEQLLARAKEHESLLP